MQFAKLNGLSAAEVRKINSRERGRGGRERSEGEHPFHATYIGWSALDQLAVYLSRLCCYVVASRGVDANLGR